MCALLRHTENQLQPVQTGYVASGFKRFFISEKLELQLTVRFFAVRSGSVPVFFRLHEPDFQTLVVLQPPFVLRTGKLKQTRQQPSRHPFSPKKTPFSHFFSVTYSTSGTQVTPLDDVLLATTEYFAQTSTISTQTSLALSTSVPATVPTSSVTIRIQTRPRMSQNFKMGYPTHIDMSQSPPLAALFKSGKNAKIGKQAKITMKFRHITPFFLRQHLP